MMVMDFLCFRDTGHGQNRGEVRNGCCKDGKLLRRQPNTFPGALKIQIFPFLNTVCYIMNRKVECKNRACIAIMSVISASLHIQKWLKLQVSLHLVNDGKTMRTSFMRLWKPTIRLISSPGVMCGIR